MTDISSIFFGVEIPEPLLANELQNHQAASLSEARAMAGRALAAKAVLLDRAEELELESHPERNEEGQEETIDEALVRAILSEEVETEPPTEAKAREIYDRQPEAFTSPPLLEASHILIAPEEGTEVSLQAAHEIASTLIGELKQHPERFGRIAAGQSACPSAKDGGMLGQLRPGDVVDGIWKRLFALNVGEIAGEPVQTQHGWHILRLDHRADGAQLPFEHVRPHIAAKLEAQAWTLTAARYVDDLLAVSAAKPGLKLGETGGLDHNPSGVELVTGLLGSVLSDEARALASLREEALVVVEAAAKSRDRDAACVLRKAIRSFLAGADDEAWTQIISRLRDSETPLPDCLDVIITHEFPPLKAKKH